MAKRRQLEAPSAEALRDIEEGFARETLRDPLGVRMPIASVAGESAALGPAGSVEERARAARDGHDAERLRTAEERGLLVTEIPLAAIHADELSRDRMTLNPEEMEELKTSILSSGLRMPIEVFALPDPTSDGARFGLLSGYRRLAAVRALHSITGRADFATIRALIRDPGSVPRAIAAMVEENEIRSGLSQFERGRIAVLAAEQGAFASVEEAIDTLFAAGSKAKRSKLRSFASVHAQLGDLLAFPQALSERAGLRLAGALRAGLTEDLRRALADARPEDAEAEWKVMEPILRRADAVPRVAERGGRPRSAARQGGGAVVDLPGGLTLRHERDARGHAIRLEGAEMTDAEVEGLMDQLRQLLER
ncbi:ParB/RepB/Spo0J family partition protein [Brevirhabdus sp.]|uniref:ParB/RepB/Spo0J family partition protein n=1 Tax=Brevirhabdus sp. TaxID=2004514 RepID=UPI004057CF91